MNKSKRVCPDCKGEEILYRCEYCGCQWKETSRTPEKNRSVDPRLIDAIDEINKYLASMLDKKSDLELMSGINGVYISRIITGIKRTRGILYKHIHELKGIDE